jgi:hypothetical protein
MAAPTANQLSEMPLNAVTGESLDASAGLIYRVICLLIPSGLPYPPLAFGILGNVVSPLL